MQTLLSPLQSCSEGSWVLKNRIWLDEVVTKKKLELLTVIQPISQVTWIWGKECDFIQKACKPRRWTSILKNNLEKVQNSGFFNTREGGKQEGFEVRKRLMTADI